MSIMEYNGAAIIAMTGHNCVAIATDTRLGIQAQTVSMNYNKVFKMNSHLFLGLPGLATDVETVRRTIQLRLNLLQLREDRLIKPSSFMHMVSSFLYERRFGPFFVEPVIAGMHPTTYQPYVATMDLIGCPMEKEDFVVGGTCTEQMYGMCEALWKPNMTSSELFEAISQSILNAVDRDALSGWGCIVHLMEKDQITTYKLKARMD